jgi:hypothetical protein
MLVLVLAICNLFSTSLALVLFLALVKEKSRA